VTGALNCLLELLLALGAEIGTAAGDNLALRGKEFPEIFEVLVVNFGIVAVI
jgi:hypothetical protein